MGVIILLVGLSLCHAPAESALPWVVGGLVGAAIAGLGTYTGGQQQPGPPVRPGHLRRAIRLPGDLPDSATGRRDAGRMAAPDSVPLRADAPTLPSGPKPDEPTLTTST